MSRLQKLRQSLKQKELDVLVISQQENRRYLSGFTGVTGWLLISDNSTCLAVDFRYVEQAKKESPDFDVIHIKGDTAGWLPKLASDSGFKRVGFEADQVPFAVYQQLCRTINDDGYRFQLIPTIGLFESIRAVKEPEELKSIAEAVKLADAAFDHAKLVLRPGVSEKDVAWELGKFLRAQGRERVPFDIVLGAQLTALATIVAGMNGDQADQLARTVIEQANYGDAFGHGLGHGVGLEAHEPPRLGPNSSDLLSDGMVFTIEPGIYIAGWGGVRIEDTVVMENGKIKALTSAEKIAHTC